MAQPAVAPIFDDLVDPMGDVRVVDFTAKRRLDASRLSHLPADRAQQALSILLDSGFSSEQSHAILVIADGMRAGEMAASQAETVLGRFGLSKSAAGALAVRIQAAVAR
jgi:hypothetical protein